MLIQHSVNSDWLFNTQLRVLQADWFILEINERQFLTSFSHSVLNPPSFTFLPISISLLVFRIMYKYNGGGE